MLPPALLRRFEVEVTPRSDVKPLKMRQVQSAAMGSLVTVRVCFSDSLSESGCALLMYYLSPDVLC